MTHSERQPGLHIHSHDPEFDLMKRYRVDQQCVRGFRRVPHGWLCRKSFNTLVGAQEYVRQRLDSPVSERNLSNVYQIVDQSSWPDVVVEAVG